MRYVASLPPRGGVPKYFLTKVWGFSPHDYPVLGFPVGGGLNKFLKESRLDDWVVVAGTKGDNTSADERGRLLGMMRLGRNMVPVVRVLKSLGTKIPRAHLRADGSYRWPTGLPMVEARRFVDAPDLDEVFGKYHWRQEWATYALDLTEKFEPDAIARLLALPTERVSVTLSPIIARQTVVDDVLELNRRPGPTGPAPANHRNAVDRDPPWGSAYLFRLRGRHDSLSGLPILKVGRAVDVAERLGTLNRGLISTVTGYLWEYADEWRFWTENQAHAFEQAVHARLAGHVVEGQTEVYRMREDDLRSEWMNVFTQGKWALHVAAEVGSSAQENGGDE